MKRSIRFLCPGVAGFGMLMLAALIVPSAAKADSYNAHAGGETKDESVQADGFFPNELWLQVNDTITWTFAPKNEPHTVTFLTPGQVRPSFQAGCPGVVPGTLASPAVYNGSTTCVNSGEMSGGTTYTVKFTHAGNYKLVCLIHTDMNGTVHVLDPTVDLGTLNLIHSSRFYEDQAHDELQAVLSDDNRRGEDDRGWGDRKRDDHTVTAGIGEVVATGGGLQYRTVLRFLPGTIRIRAGESVLWTNLDPTEPHTVTFGYEPTAGPGLIPTFFSLPPVEPYVAPGNPVPPVPSAAPKPCTALVTTDCQNQDTGTVLATINCTPSGTPPANTSPCSAFGVQPPASPYYSLSFLNSGFIQAQAPDRTGSAQLPPGTTRIRVTFPHAGTYYYHCALHDVDGMLGEVIVE
jgi:plastocyanin